MAAGSERDSGHPATLGFVARATLVVLSICGLVALLWLGRDILFVAFFGALFALFLSLLVDPLVRWGVPRVLAAIIVVLGLLGLFVLVIWLIWPTLQVQITLVSRQLPAAFDDVATWVQAQYEAIVGEVGIVGGERFEPARLLSGDLVGGILAGAIPLLQTVSGVVAGSLLVLVTGIYLSIEPETYLRGLVSLVPYEGRERFRTTLYHVAADLRGWILGTVINMSVIGVLTALGLYLMGIPAALVLGLIAFFLEFIPFYGPVLSAVPAVAVAFLTSGKSALAVIVLYTVIQQAEGNLLQPLVMRETVRLPPALTVLVGAFMAILFGFLGLLLAVPLLATAIVLVKRLYVQPLNIHALRVVESGSGIRDSGGGG